MSWVPPIILYNGYRISFPGVKRPRLGVDFLHPSSADVEEIIELYLHTPSGTSWPVLWRTSLYLLIITRLIGIIIIIIT